MLESYCSEIFLSDAACAFVRLSTPCPAPQTLPDRRADLVEDALRYNMSMIVCPSANQWIELMDQKIMSRRRAAFHDVPQHAQKALNARLGHPRRQPDKHPNLPQEWRCGSSRQRTASPTARAAATSVVLRLPPQTGSCPPLPKET